jgi:hypothetical protein
MPFQNQQKLSQIGPFGTIHLSLGFHRKPPAVSSIHGARTFFFLPLDIEPEQGRGSPVTPESGRRQPRDGIEGQSEHPGARPHLWDSEDGRKVDRGILATSSDAAVEAALVATPTESGGVEWRGAAASQDPHAPVEGRGLVGDGRRRRGHERRWHGTTTTGGGSAPTMVRTGKTVRKVQRRLGKMTSRSIEAQGWWRPKDSSGLGA